MDIKEKIYLTQCLLEDIRMNWANPNDQRPKLAHTLCTELANDIHMIPRLAEDFNTLATTIDNYTGRDGRYFRNDFPYGYINMDRLHGLQHTLYNKSDKFKAYVNEYITFPEYIFED